MIRSFAQRDAELLFNDRPVWRFAAIERIIRRKLLLLHAAARLDDLLLARRASGGDIEKRVRPLAAA